MDQLEFTKIAGAILAALLLIFGTKTIIDTRLEHAGQKVGYALGGAEAPAKETAAAPAIEGAAPVKPVAAKEAAAPAKEPAATPTKEATAPAKEAAPKEAAAAKPEAAAAVSGPGGDVVALLGKANAENGQAIFKKCQVCHTYEKGKPKAIGPNLYGIVNRPKGSFEGFEYSAGMKAKGGNWTFEDLAKFITKPSAYVAGTKMVFAGLSNPAEAADVLAYLATLADSPVPLPK